MTIAQRCLILLLRGYQATLSPFLATVLGSSSHCRFRPTCSRYALQAIHQHGAIIGSWLALKRLARCHPWGKFGDDPVPDLAKRSRLKFKVPRLSRCHHGS